MKNFILYITLCFSIVCTAQTKYGAGVTHTEAPPQYVPNYAVNPSLLAYDSTEQAIYVNSKVYGWWKLFSPFERYVRTFTNINFANGQIFTWSNIEAFITSSAGGSSMKKNGYYIVKFTANATGIDLASVDFTNVLITVPNNPIPVSNNDYFLVRYYRGQLISLVWINDKQNVSFQIINNQVDFHTRQIDSLRNRLDTLKVTPSVNSDDWSLNGNTITDSQFLGTINNEDIIFKTNNIQRNIFKRTGKNGFGVPLPTQEVDALNYRNRGKYFDASNFYGSNYQVLMSNDSVTYWTDNVRNLTYQAFHTDSVVRVKKRTGFVVMPIDGVSNYKIKSITFAAFEYGSDSFLTIKYLVRRANTGVLDELRRDTGSSLSTGFNFADVGQGGYVEGGDVIYLEIVNVFGQSVKGLNVTISFVYSN